MSVFKTWDLWRQAYTAAGYVDDEEQDMTTLREAAQQALEYMDAPSAKLWPAGTQHRIITALRVALAEPVQEPVAGRAFLERILTAMEGVIDVADRKTDEFDALRSCVIDLTMMLHTTPTQRPAEPVAWTLTKTLDKRETTTNGYLWFSDPQNSSWTPLYTSPPQRKPLTEEDIERLLSKHERNYDMVKFARAIERAHGIKEHTCAL